MVAEPLELVDGVTAGAFGVAAGVVVGAWVVVERSGMGHGPDRDQDRVFDWNECLFGSATGGDASVLRGKVARPNADPLPCLMTVSAIDGAEALVLLTALRQKAIDQPGGWAFVAADAGSAAALTTRIVHLRRLTTQ